MEITNAYLKEVLARIKYLNEEQAKLIDNLKKVVGQIEIEVLGEMRREDKYENLKLEDDIFKQNV